MNPDEFQHKLAPLQTPLPALHAVLSKLIQERQISSFEELNQAVGLPGHALLSLATGRTSTRAVAILSERLHIPAHELFYMLEPDAYGNPQK